MTTKIILSTALMLCAASASAQGTAEDYQRAFQLSGKYSNAMTNGDVSAQAIRGTHRFWYTVTENDGIAYKLVDAEKKTCSELLNPETLAKVIKEQTGENLNGKYLRLNNMWVDENNNAHFQLRKRHWTYNISNNELTKGDTIYVAGINGTDKPMKLASRIKLKKGHKYQITKICDGDAADKLRIYSAEFNGQVEADCLPKGGFVAVIVPCKK